MNVIDFTKVVLKPIPGYEGYYSATKDGKIYRHARKNVKEGWVKERRNREYSQIPLQKDGVRKWLHVHRLVAITYIPNPGNKPQVNHINCDKHDNRVSNLEWVTWRENWEHARDHGKYRGRMLNDEERLDMYRLYLDGCFTYKMLAERFSVGTSSVHRHLTKMRQQVETIMKAA